MIISCSPDSYRDPQISISYYVLCEPLYIHQRASARIFFLTEFREAGFFMNVSRKRVNQLF